MVRWFIESISRAESIFRSSTGVTKAVDIKEPLLLIESVAHLAAAGFLSRYLNDPLPYARRHITINKMLSASLNKTLPSKRLWRMWDGAYKRSHAANRKE